MICRYCAETIPDGSEFCPKCGARMLATPTPPPPVAPGFTPPAPLPPGFVPPTDGKAIGSLICGFFFFFLPAAIVGIILGHLSLSEIGRSAGRLKGKGLAVAGLIFSYLGIAFIPLLIIAAIAIPNLLRARMAANEASAAGSVRVYNTALVSYSAMCPNQGFPASTRQLGPGAGDCNGANLIEQTLASSRAVKNGYLFTYHPGPVDEQGHIVSYVVSADPVIPNNTGVRHFYADETGVIRFEMSGSAGPDSQPLE